MTASFTSYKYGGTAIVPTVIAVSTSAGTTGFSDETPFIIWNSPFVYAESPVLSLASIINLSILGR